MKLVESAAADVLQQLMKSYILFQGNVEVPHSMNNKGEGKYKYQCRKRNKVELQGTGRKQIFKSSFCEKHLDF